MKSLCLGLVLCLVSSCALSYKMPDNRFETSETTGKLWGTRLYTGVGNGKDVTVTPDFSQVWADPNDPGFARAGFFLLGGELGMHERIDVGLQHVSDLGTMLKAKYQFIGQSGVEGFQASVAAHAGGGSEEKSETSQTPTRAELDTSVIGADLIVGYRFNPIVLVYASFFHDSFSYKVNQTMGANQKNIEGKSKNTGGTFGASFLINKTLEITAEYSGATGRSAGDRFWTNSFGGILGLHF